MRLFADRRRRCCGGFEKTLVVVEMVVFVRKFVGERLNSQVEVLVVKYCSFVNSKLHIVVDNAKRFPELLIVGESA